MKPKAWIPASERFRRAEHTQCGRSRTPGNGARRTQCRQNDYGVVAEMCR